MKSPAHARASRGAALIEALIAFAVTAAASLAVLAGEAALHRGADLARQRGEAVRLAARVAEHWRVQGLQALQADAVAPSRPVGPEAPVPSPQASTPADEGAAPAYTVSVQASRMADAALVGMRVAAIWVGRDGTPEQLVLDTLFGTAEPALAGLLTLTPHGLAGRAPLGRHGGVPVGARPLGDGTSLFTPPGGRPGGPAWRFSDATGLVVQVCTLAGDGGPTGCFDASGAVVSGLVRFATGGPVSAADAENPSGSAALPLDMQLALATAGASATCLDDAPEAASPHTPLVHYACLVASEQPWSGRLSVAPLGWRTGATPESFRVCRYSAERDGRPGRANAEHPRDYVEVQGSLLQQHFLVVRGDVACPVDVAPDPSRGDHVDSSTIELAPQALPD